MKSSRLFALALLLPLLGQAQFRRPAWNTFGADAQRTGWNQSETDLNTANVKNLKLEWSTKLDSPPSEMNNLTVPVERADMATPRGVKDLIVVAGVSGKLFVLDGDTGKIAWQKTLETQGTPQRGPSWLCPNGLTATPILGLLPGKGNVVFVLAGDGRLHAFNLVSGEDMLPPTPFVPAFAKMWSLNLVNNVLYTTTSQGCNGVKSGVYSLDLADPAHKVNHFTVSVSGAGIWGRAGAAVTADNSKVIVETGDGPYDPAQGNYSDSVLAFSAKDLKLEDYFTPPNRAWITKKDLDMGSISPVVFPFKNWELAAASGKEGVIFLLDTKSLGGADHRTPLWRSPRFTNDEVNFATKGFWGAFSTWEDKAGTRWLYAPAWGPPSAEMKFPAQYGATPEGSVMAFKVEQKGEKPVLTPAWNSVNMNVPTPVIIANGVVYALADGDYAVQFGPNGNLLNSQARREKTGHAILYALDATTGKVLYSSGDTIRSFSHFSGFSMAGGRIYVGTYDGTVYAFGLGLQQ
ncbi:MAG TPA: PQQ-binding-like beta-propeller repeat protein [Bryobacteraceae bacterium]|nr:PQQ-binding-like beta-propeller repeat protein [Bryobacteraceae bacterium]